MLKGGINLPRPVSDFLRKHCYYAFIENYNLSPKMSMFLTFLLSSCVHEFVAVLFYFLIIYK